MSAARRLLLEGLSDAVGFVGGALAGYGVSLLLGMDVFAEGYGTATLLSADCRASGGMSSASSSLSQSISSEVEGFFFSPGMLRMS